VKDFVEKMFAVVIMIDVVFVVFSGI